MSASSRSRGIAIRIIGAGAVLAVFGFGWRLFQPAPVEVEVTTPRRASMQVTVREQAETRVRDRYEVSAPVAGHVLRIQVQPGDSVVAHRTPLVTLTPSSPPLLDVRTRSEAGAVLAAAESALRAAQADRERVAAELAHAERELVRVRGLVAGGAAPSQQLDGAEADTASLRSVVKGADAAIAAATAGVARARAALAPVAPERPTLVIRSPVTGVVLTRRRESEAVVAQGEALVEVGDIRQLEVVADVLSSDAVAIRPGQAVLVDQWGGAGALPGRVRRVEPSGFTKVSALGVEEQRVNVIVDPDPACPDWRQLGDRFRVEVAIVVWEAVDVLTVPIGSLVRHGDEWSVFVVRNGRAARTAVQIGHQNDSDAEVLGGLTTVDSVVVYPGESIDDGVAIVPR
jgi:HlyD family secretion protein